MREHPDHLKAAPWPAARADHRNSGCTQSLGPSRPRLKWSYRLEVTSGASPTPDAEITGPAIVDGEGRVYLAFLGGLAALAPTGERLWLLDFGGATAPPVLDASGGLVTAVQRLGVVRVASSGQVMAQSRCDLEWPTGVSLAEDGAIYVADFGALYAFGHDARLRWRIPFEGAAAFGPAVSPAGLLYLKSARDDAANEEGTEQCRDYLYAFAGDGTVRVRRETCGECYDGAGWGRYGLVTGGNCAAVCHVDGTVLTGFGKLILAGAREIPHRGGGPIAVDRDGAMYVAGYSLVVFAANGVERWRAKAGDDWLSHPVVDGAGRVYCAAAARVWAVSPDGRVVWTWDVPGPYPYERTPHALAIGTDQTLYVTTPHWLHALGE